MATILMMPAKLATLGLLKIKVFKNKGFDVKTSVYDIHPVSQKCTNDSGK